jgi:hypothetical protein
VNNESHFYSVSQTTKADGIEWPSAMPSAGNMGTVDESRAQRPEPPGHCDSKAEPRGRSPSANSGKGSKSSETLHRNQAEVTEYMRSYPAREDGLGSKDQSSLSYTAEPIYVPSRASLSVRPDIRDDSQDNGRRVRGWTKTTASQASTATSDLPSSGGRRQEVDFAPFIRRSSNLPTPCCAPGEGTSTVARDSSRIRFQRQALTAIVPDYSHGQQLPHARTIRGSMVDAQLGPQPLQQINCRYNLLGEFSVSSSGSAKGRGYGRQYASQSNIDRTGYAKDAQSKRKDHPQPVNNFPAASQRGAMVYENPYPSSFPAPGCSQHGLSSQHAVRFHPSMSGEKENTMSLGGRDQNNDATPSQNTSCRAVSIGEHRAAYQARYAANLAHGHNYGTPYFRLEPPTRNKHFLTRPVGHATLGTKQKTSFLLSPPKQTVQKGHDAKLDRYAAPEKGPSKQLQPLVLTSGYPAAVYSNGPYCAPMQPSRGYYNHYTPSPQDAFPASHLPPPGALHTRQSVYPDYYRSAQQSTIKQDSRSEQSINDACSRTPTRECFSAEKSFRRTTEEQREQVSSAETPFLSPTPPASLAITLLQSRRQLPAQRLLQDFQSPLVATASFAPKNCGLHVDEAQQGQLSMVHSEPSVEEIRQAVNHGERLDSKLMSLFSPEAVTPLGRSLQVSNPDSYFSRCSSKSRTEKSDVMIRAAYPNPAVCTETSPTPTFCSFHSVEAPDTGTSLEENRATSTKAVAQGEAVAAQLDSQFLKSPSVNLDVHLEPSPYCYTADFFSSSPDEPTSPHSSEGPVESAVVKRKKPKKKRIKRVRRKCTVGDCENRVVQGGVCISHGAKRKLCTFEGCIKGVKTAGRCSAHGPPRKRCYIEGCKKVSVQGGRCIAHGGKKKSCSVEDCCKVGMMKGMCKRHHDQHFVMTLQANGRSVGQATSTEEEENSSDDCSRLELDLDCSEVEAI